MINTMTDIANHVSDETNVNMILILVDKFIDIYTDMIKIIKSNRGITFLFFFAEITSAIMKRYFKRRSLS